jgi:hypothetical protein
MVPPVEITHFGQDDERVSKSQIRVNRKIA